MNDGLNELLDKLKEEDKILAQKLALVRYKAAMWDRNSHRYPAYAMSDEEFYTQMKIQWGWCTNEWNTTLTEDEVNTLLEPSPLAPDFREVIENHQERLATPAQLAAEGSGGGKTPAELALELIESSGSSIKGETTYSGYSEEDIPGIARKGEN